MAIWFATSFRVWLETLLVIGCLDSASKETPGR